VVVILGLGGGVGWVIVIERSWMSDRFNVSVTLTVKFEMTGAVGVPKIRSEHRSHRLPARAGYRIDQRFLQGAWSS
jgi:hypothetical protein